MLGTQFYNQAVRKTVISFGTLFNNIELKKTVNGQVLETEKVPLAYGPKQKFLYRIFGRMGGSYACIYGSKINGDIINNHHHHQSI